MGHHCQELLACIGLPPRPPPPLAPTAPSTTPAVMRWEEAMSPRRVARAVPVGPPLPLARRVAEVPKKKKALRRAPLARRAEKMTQTAAAP